MSFIKRFPDWWEFRSFAVFCCNGYCCLLLRMRICFASIDAERCNCYSVREDFAYFPDSPLKTGSSGTSLVGQWLRLHTPKAGGLGSIPDQGTRSCMPLLKIPHAITKTQHGQLDKLKKKKKSGTTVLNGRLSSCPYQKRCLF